MKSMVAGRQTQEKCKLLLELQAIETVYRFYDQAVNISDYIEMFP